jgi:hypothetical protein
VVPNECRSRVCLPSDPAQARDLKLLAFIERQVNGRSKTVIKELFDCRIGNPKALTGDMTQRKLDRMFRSKSMMAWSELLRDAILAKLDLTDADDRVCPFYREMDKRQLDGIRQTVARLFNWKFWSDPGEEIDRVLSDNKSEVKEWFRKHDLTTGYLLGAPA